MTFCSEIVGTELKLTAADQLSEEEFFAWQRAFEAGLARCTRRGAGRETTQSILVYSINSILVCVGRFLGDVRDRSAFCRITKSPL